MIESKIIEELGAIAPNGNKRGLIAELLDLR